MQIDRERMEKALNYLSDTDVEYAQTKTLYDGLNELKRSVKASNMMRSNQTSAGMKEQQAYDSMEYRSHLKKMEDAEFLYLTLQARRSTAAIVIECWRSINAARGKGMII